MHHLYGAVRVMEPKEMRCRQVGQGCIISVVRSRLSGAVRSMCGPGSALPQPHKREGTFWAGARHLLGTFVPALRAEATPHLPCIAVHSRA